MSTNLGHVPEEGDYDSGVNVFEYLSAESDRAERQRAQMADSFKRHWLVFVALIFGIVGAVFFGPFFRAESTETESSGHLWWKDETTTTTEVPMGTRLVFLLFGLTLLTIGALCVYVPIKQARRRAAQRKYLAILTGVERMKVHQIAGIAGASQATVYRGRLTRLALSLAGQPGVHVADEVAELASDMDGARPTAAEAPVVEGPDRDVEVLRQFLDAHQRLQAAESGCSGLHPSLGEGRRPHSPAPTVLAR